MWRRRRGKAQSRVRGEKRREEREHLRRRLNLIHRTEQRTRKGIEGPSSQGQAYNKRGNNGKKTEKVDDPSGPEHEKEMDRGGGNFRRQEKI